MINHARTLLVNADGAKRLGLSYPGEEYIPADFRPVGYSSWLNRYLGVLFGSAPDDLFVNQRMAQVLTACHAAEDYSDYLTAFDSRITYDVTQAPYSLREHVFGIVSQQANVPNTSVLAVGNTSADTKVGQADRSWTIRLTSATQAVATQLRTGREITSGVALTNGATSPIALPGVSFQAQILTGSLSAGASWTFTHHAKLAESLPELLTRLASPSREGEMRLFGMSAVEPYTTFYGLWKSHFSAAHRLLGIIAAMAYRCEEHRTMAVTD